LDFDKEIEMVTEQQKRVARVLDKIKQMVYEEDDNASMFADMLEAGLNDLQECDAFGTEGQCDPRGDFRNGTWSMDNIEGI
jgi:hypothetical protein